MQRSENMPVPEADTHRSGGLISILEEIQTKHGYLPVDELQRVAVTTGKSLVDIYGVATFFRAFSLTPRGKHLVSACLGTACHVRGGPAIAKELERQLGIKAGETTPDREFTFETVNCLGACALGPVVVVDGHYFSKVKPSAVRNIIDQIRSGLETADVRNDSRVFPLDVSCTRCNHTLMDSTRLVDDRASIGLIVTTSSGHGKLYLSSLYGSASFVCDLDIPTATITELYCPRCQSSMTGDQPCAECGAPVASLFVSGGAVLQICSRRECPAHMLDLSGVNLWSGSGATEMSADTTPSE
jgi:NADH:ubiquinone oxidoreductase subunit E